MQLSQQQNTFSEFFFEFLKSILNFQNFLKMMTLVADVCREIAAPRNMVR